MSRVYKIHNQEKLYFVTFTVIEWLDVFVNEEYRDIFLRSVKFCQKEKGLEVYAWCIMTNHVHMIIGTEGKMKLEDIIRDLKSFTSRQIRKAIETSKGSRKVWMLNRMKTAGHLNRRNKDFQFWQQHNYPIELSDNNMMDQRLNYIHNNPVKAGFVSRPEDWLYSSARDYCGENGLLEILFIE